MKKIVFLDRATIGPSVSLNKPHVEHHWVEYPATDSADVVTRLKGATVAITNKVAIQRESIEQLPELTLIVVAATGYDCVDLVACREFGVTVTNVRGYAATTVPEHVLALMLALRRNLVGYRSDVIDGAWERSGQFCFFNHPISDLADQTLGIVGKGVLGQAVGRLGAALGMRVQYAGRKGDNTPSSGYVPFDEFLASSDVISLHCPLTDMTRNLISYEEFSKMRRKPILINTGRGGLVDEVALVDAVHEGKIMGAGFDVVSSEPMVAGHILESIIELPNVIVTPHVAWASQEAMQTLWDQVVRNIDNYFLNQPTNVLN